MTIYITIYFQYLTNLAPILFADKIIIRKKNISLKKHVKFCTFYSMVLKSTDIALNKLIFTALKLKRKKKTCIHKKIIVYFTEYIKLEFHQLHL